MPKPEGKSFAIPKQLVWEAWRRVKDNKGAPGVDGQDLEQFEAGSGGQPLQGLESDELGDLVSTAGQGGRDPQAARPGCSCARRADDRRQGRADGGSHVSWSRWWSPGFIRTPMATGRSKSAHDALAACRERCWKFDWAIDLDVQKFFDEVPWDLVVRAVEAVTDCRWVLLYVKRWLQAPLEHSDGTLEKRSKGTPQGSAISPCLANLFMHYAFDLWMVRNHPDCPFERFADDAIVHCRSRAQAEVVLAGIIKRMEEVGLRLHPDKTRIVYCKDSNRRGDHEHTSFTFLGYAFRPREARSKHGVNFTSFLPAISPEALKAKSDRLREMRIPKRTDLTLDDLARWLNPIVAGWINYYGRYYRSGIDPLLQRVSSYLRRWAARKYRRLRSAKRFDRWWTELLMRQPGLFVHWRLVRNY